MNNRDCIVKCKINWRLIVNVSIVAFLIILPWQTRLIWRDAQLNGAVLEYGRLSIYATQVFLWLVIALGLVAHWRALWQPARLDFAALQKHWQQPVARVYWLATLLVLWIGCSTAWSYDRQLSWQQFLFITQALALVVLWLRIGIEQRFIAVGLVVSASIVSLVGLTQWFIQYIPASTWLGLAAHDASTLGVSVIEATTGRWLRAYGPFPHPNMFGGWLAVGLMAAVQLFSIFQRRWQGIFVAMSLPLITWGLLFSFSRSAWLAVAVGLSVWLYVERKVAHRLQQRHWLILGIIFAAVAMWFFIWGSLTWNRIASLALLQTESIQSRQVLLRQAQVLIAHHPIIGVGAGAYTAGVQAIIANQMPGWWYQPVHLVPMLMLAELGVIGGLLLGVLALAILFLLRRGVWTEKVILPISGLTIVLMSSLFDHYWWTQYSSLTLVIILFGLLLAAFDTPLGD